MRAKVRPWLKDFDASFATKWKRNASAKSIATSARENMTFGWWKMAASTA
jgi:hypothetical protein